jgi:hypothetical protein
MICVQCRHRIPDAHGTCPNCGRPAEALPGALRWHSDRARGTRKPFFDVSRWSERDRIAGISSAVLLISLFLPWFGVSFLGFTATADGLQSHPFLRIVLFVGLAILGYLVLRISPLRRVLPPPRAHERIMLTATAVNLALVVLAIIAVPGGGGLLSHQYGSFVGGIAALAAVVPLGAAVFNVTERWPL